MNILGIVHLLAALLTVFFVVFTLFQVFHWYSLRHRFNKMTARMKPMIIGRNSKNHILELMKLDGFPDKEVEEVYDLLEQEIESRRNQTPKA